MASESVQDPKPLDTEKSGEKKSDMTNILQHIKNLETNNNELKGKLQDAETRNGKLSAKTREGMQSALDSLMKKWMDAVETKDDKVKDSFKDGLNKLVEKSAEDNGVWQMMVAASSLHERQSHDLDQLRIQNDELKSKVDGMYGDTDSRTVGRKGKASEQLAREDVAVDPADDMWGDFAKTIGTVY
tara:strand:+ start:50 stop:607 length:558 start_codon:yes stop_codon:yes gene_type:complete